MRHSIRLSTPLFWFALCACGMPAAAEVYQWTDAEGNAHFGDRPPQSGARTVPLPESSAPPAPTPEERLEKQRKLLRAFEEERRQDRDVRAQAQRDKAERQRNCITARDRLLVYERSSGIYDLDATGERVYLEEGQRDRFLAERRQDVEDWCDK